MSTMWNPTPLVLKGRYAGIQYIFPPGQKIVIKTIKRRSGTSWSEEIARKLYDDLGSKGLILINEEDPLPMDQYKRISLKALASWIREQIHSFNDFNQNQASENLKIQLPSETLKYHQSLLVKLEGHEEKIVSKTELDAIAARGEMNAYASLYKIRAAMDAGDWDGVRAALPQKMLEDAAGKMKKDPQAPGGITDRRMGVPEKGPAPVEATTTKPAEEQGPAPVEAAPSAQVTAPDTKKPAPDYDTQIVTPERPQGHGAGRIPTRARTVGGPGQRSGGPPAQE